MKEGDDSRSDYFHWRFIPRVLYSFFSLAPSKRASFHPSAVSASGLDGLGGRFILIQRGMLF
jgi:hypothetical protein